MADIAYDDLYDDRSFTATIYRSWMHIKALFPATLKEAIKGAKAAVEEYSEILEEGHLTMDITDCIKEQKMQMENDLNKIKTLEHLA